ncbi:Carbohydrate-selective porin, OprB family [Posidoniimonas polymericola]|uniref:Carbohydrate-selective porin, OprB family n=1 Tax=Posidoniimonas polymericola TaxID=2528002 RepID=A0A5C5YL62_9BACT|nr:carbohydrate porin [Posidoniimonas polymericola]TWT75612.1 Carbohydrate-selective porin, OprB family [Posidoniimonas polymericola]
MRRPIALLLNMVLLASAASAQSPAPLTGDWLGNRAWLAEHGVTFNLDVANFYMGVASGGLERHFPYGGHGDYVTNVDFGKLCGREGLFLKIRAEHRFGENINRSTGAFLPAAVLADLPVADSEQLLLTNVLFTQALSERFAVFFGKLDTLDGDANAFAHGRGKTQFSNVGFVANPIALRTVPYSTLGCGFAVLGEGGEPVFSYMVLNPTDTADTDGFDELFAEGVAMAAELRLPTNFAGMPGHQLFAATWNSRDYVSLGQDPRVVFPNVPINEVTGSWSAYWNFDQYLVHSGCDPTVGWGVFGRAGVADDRANPLAWFLSFGVGGHNMMAGHEADTFGAGWFISGTSNEVGPLLQATLGPLGDGQGVELFYNWQATPWLNVTPDLQVIVPAREQVDTALALGVRAVVTL